MCSAHPCPQIGEIEITNQRETESKVKTITNTSSRFSKKFLDLDFFSRKSSTFSIDSQYERTPPPWEHSNIMFDISLSCFKKEQTSETVLKKEFQQLRERYNSYFEAYTDGSKSEHKVAAAAFFTKDPDNPKTTRLRDGSSVFNAELEGILLRPNLKESLCNTTQPLYRKQETVMTRLRIGHTWITHSYLLKKEDQPFCHACDNPFTVKHILVECSDFTHIRNKYYTTTDVHTLFREVDSSKITEYLKEIKLFDKI